MNNNLHPMFQGILEDHLKTNDVVAKATISKRSVKITLKKNGNCQKYDFDTEAEARDFYRSKLYLEPLYEVEMV